MIAAADIVGYSSLLVMGVVMGFFGGGGAILTVPILAYIFSQSVQAATLNSLFIVGVSASMGALRAFRRRELDGPAGLWFLGPSIVGVLVARRLVLPALPDSILEIGLWSLRKEALILGVFALVMLSAAFAMIRSSSDPGTVARSRFGGVARSFGVGLITGFVGAGGGFLIVPALVVFMGVPMSIAVGTSLFVIMVNSLAGFAADLIAGYRVDFGFLGLATLFGIWGLLTGSRLRSRWSAPHLKRAFGYFVLATGLGILTIEILKMTKS